MAGRRSGRIFGISCERTCAIRAFSWLSSSPKTVELRLRSNERIAALAAASGEAGLASGWCLTVRKQRVGAVGLLPAMRKTGTQVSVQLWARRRASDC